MIECFGVFSYFGIIWVWGLGYGLWGLRIEIRGVGSRGLVLRVRRLRVWVGVWGFTWGVCQGLCFGFLGEKIGGFQVRGFQPANP